MPFFDVLPSAASPKIVSISCSERARWANLAGEASGTVAGVPELVSGTREHTDLFSRGEVELLSGDLHADAPLEDTEALGLARMHVRCRDRRARAKDGFDEDRLAAGVARRAMKDEDLAGDGVLDRLATADHVGFLGVVRHFVLHPQPAVAQLDEEAGEPASLRRRAAEFAFGNPH